MARTKATISSEVDLGNLIADIGVSEILSEIHITEIVAFLKATLNNGDIFEGFKLSASDAISHFGDTDIIDTLVNVNGIDELIKAIGEDNLISGMDRGKLLKLWKEEYE